MNHELITPPNTLTFITTFKCTSACKDCCFKCSPKRKERLTLKDMKSFIDETLEAYSTIKVLVLTGGECFTLGEDLPKIIEYGSLKGLIVRIVTNGFWAKTYDIAIKKLIPLLKLGLKELNFSTGDDHLKFVPDNYIINGAKASMELGLTTVINVESAEDRMFKSEIFFKNESLQKYIFPTDKNIIPLKIINGVWMPFTKTTESNIKSKKLEKKSINMIVTDNRCTNLFNIITIDPNYQMIACCGLTSHCIRYLNLGDVKKYPIKELYENQFNDFMKIWLSVDGPHYIINYISKRLNHENPIMSSDSHMCQVCERILNSQEFINIIKEDYEKLYTNVVFKYLFNKQTN